MSALHNGGGPARRLARARPEGSPRPHISPTPTLVDITPRLPLTPKKIFPFLHRMARSLHAGVDYRP